jgi:hypothetical protein
LLSHKPGQRLRGFIVGAGTCMLQDAPPAAALAPQGENGVNQPAVWGLIAMLWLPAALSV